jgi:Ca2+-binding EF-hand superfamily protein
MGDLQKIYDTLRKLDTAKNGKLDPNAVKSAAESILQERVNDAFNRLDTNKDGKIGKDEARGLIKEHFNRIDTNHDGFIEHDELLKAARERRDHRSPDGKQTEYQRTPRENK